MTAGQARYVVIAVTLSLAMSICALGLVVLGRYGTQEMISESERRVGEREFALEKSVGNLRQWAVAVYERLDRTCGEKDIPSVPETQ